MSDWTAEEYMAHLNGKLAECSTDAERIALLLGRCVSQKQTITELNGAVHERKQRIRNLIEHQAKELENARNDTALRAAKAAVEARDAELLRLKERLAEARSKAAELESKGELNGLLLQAANARAFAFQGRTSSLRKALLALVAAVENDKADDDAFWARLDEAARQARWVLESEYRIAKAASAKEAA